MKESKTTVFATRLRHLRQLKSKTQAECAKAFGCTSVAYGAWERGEREPSSLDTIVQICRFFNCSSDFLLGIEIDKEKEQADLAAYREEIEKYHVLRDKLQELMKNA